MKLKTLTMMVILFFGLGAFAHEEVANTITISKATELGVHRIERLVTLKKIDAFFLAGLTSLRAESTTENGATYKVYGYTESGSDGTYLAITLFMDGQGKTLSYQVTEGSKPVSPFSWPVKDASSLMEEGLHFILEGWVQNPEVKPFYTGLQSIVLTPEQDAAGNLLATFTVKSDDVAQTLIVKLKPDGTVVSHEVMSSGVDEVTLTPLEATFESIKTHILDIKCISCHAPGKPVHRIPLVTRENLLNSPLDIVIPGNADESGLILVVSGLMEDTFMPPEKDKQGKPTGYSPLSADEIQILRDWINAGASN